MVCISKVGGEGAECTHEWNASSEEEMVDGWKQNNNAQGRGESLNQKGGLLINKGRTSTAVYSAIVFVQVCSMWLFLFQRTKQQGQKFCFLIDVPWHRCEEHTHSVCHLCWNVIFFPPRWMTDSAHLADISLLSNYFQQTPHWWTQVSSFLSLNWYFAPLNSLCF